MSGEQGFIDRLRAIAVHPGARDLADDGAVLKLSSTTLVLTHDTMVEGVHWLPEQDAADVAYKLVAVNLSDLAAKGAEPLALLMGYMLGQPAWDARFAEGLAEAVARFGVPLLGGDTVAPAPGHAGGRALGLTAIGRPVAIPPPARSDALAGDALYVTGPVGAALVGFEALRGGSRDEELTRPYRRPEPLLAAGMALAGRAHAVMDISDGLLLDARRMAEASGTTIAIATPDVPVHPALADRRDEAMRWGDDYALLFTMPAGRQPPVAAHRVGEVRQRGAEPLLLDGEPPGRASRLGYEH